MGQALGSCSEGGQIRHRDAPSQELEVQDERAVAATRRCWEALQVEPPFTYLSSCEAAGSTGRGCFLCCSM